MEDIGKKYQIGALRRANDSLGDELMQLLRLPLRMIGKGGTGTDPTGEGEQAEFWALRGVSFEIRGGEAVGIIGPNGAGKSTLLKILSRITTPTTGCMRYRGRLTSLLEVGTGFNRELSGRENVFLNGAILGMNYGEIGELYERIVEFSGIARFIDTPVKHYSSGMYVRLAFAVAAHLSADILVLDEILSVGDREFRKKSLEKMAKLSSEGRSVLFVSHGTEQIRELCTRVILLVDGSIHSDGPTEEVLERYNELLIARGEAKAKPTPKPKPAAGPPGAAVAPPAPEPAPEVNEDAYPRRTPGRYVNERDPALSFQILEATVTNEAGEVTTVFDLAESVHVHLTYVLDESEPSTILTFKLAREAVMLCTSFDTDQSPELLLERVPGTHRKTVVIPPWTLKPGRHHVTAATGIVNVRRISLAEKAVSFEVKALSVPVKDKGYSSGREGVIILPLQWRD